MKKKYFLVTITFEAKNTLDASGLVEDAVSNMNCMDDVEIVHHMMEELMGKPSYL